MAETKHLSKDDFLEMKADILIQVLKRLLGHRCCLVPQCAVHVHK